jgi:hypothetical protein
MPTGYLGVALVQIAEKLTVWSYKMVQRSWTRRGWLIDLTLNAGNVDNVPAVSGVYFLSYKDGSSRKVFYVGQADNLNTRLNEYTTIRIYEHCITDCLIKNTCYFHCAAVPDKYRRDRLERALYDKYQPVCNLTEPRLPAGAVGRITLPSDN